MTSRLFRFGIISDTHVRAPGGDLSSPFPVNEKANSRAAYAASLLAAHEPAFTVHLGDMVHPLPHMGAYDAACKEAKQLFAPLYESGEGGAVGTETSSLYFVAGNHDIGDKPMPASPASGVDANGTTKYESHFGKPWYRMDYQSLALLVINSSLVNTGSADEHAQRQWLEHELADLTNADRRIFLFSHYPPFIHDSDEPEHYDNYAQPGRQWLLDLLEKYSVEAVFSGHVHHFFRNRYKNTDLYCLPATSFTRQDFAEIFRIEPAAEFGRDDTGKMHVAVVDVYQEGYRLNLIPTDGKSEGTQPTALNFNRPADCTVHLRHAWYESIDLPYNGPMEEFSRKRARNDYTLLRLMQLGLSNVRVPLQDLCDSALRQNIQNYFHSGIHFHAFSLANPPDRFIQQLKDSAVARSFEYVLPVYTTDASGLIEYADDLKKIADQLNPVPIWLGVAKSSSSTVDQADKVYAHTVSSGFAVDDSESILAIAADMNQQAESPFIAGVVFQLPWEDESDIAINRLQENCEEINSRFANNQPPLHVQLVIRIAPTNPAKENADDAAIANRVRQVLQLADACPSVSLQFDTFADMDRGYSPRHGFVDRHFNLREAGRLFMRPQD